MVLVLVYGPSYSGKTSFVHQLCLLGFSQLNFHADIFADIVQRRIWDNDLVCELDSLEGVIELLDRPCVKLVLIFVPSACDWRPFPFDDAVYTQCVNLLMLQKFSLVVIPNFSTEERFLFEAQKCLKFCKPSFDQYFMRIAYSVSLRSNCMKRRVGCVVVQDRLVISTGYNGTPFGLKNCDMFGCERCNTNTKRGVNLSNCFCLHAEENALLNCGYFKARGATLYVTTFPCKLCCRKIIQMRIARVVYSRPYDTESDKVVKKLFDESDVHTEHLKDFE